MNNAIDIGEFMLRPHLVIAGAGAKVDSIPNGDRNGNSISGYRSPYHSLNALACPSEE